MGKPGSQSQPHQSSTSITHFSHPHPLHLSICSIQSGQVLCSGCKHEASGTIYTCTLCNYSLHQKCSQMPQKITHPYDANNHVLSLLTKPAYPEGIYYCDACGDQGNGFCYHCPTCGIDLHILCATHPLLLTHQSHHHQLSLTFLAPYPTGTFSCDLCRLSGSKTWLYRCSSCEFDVHLSCVSFNARPASRAISQPPPLVSRHVALQMANPGNYIPNQGMNPVDYNHSAPAPGPGFSVFQARPQTVSGVAVGGTPYQAHSGPPMTGAAPAYYITPQNNIMPQSALGQPVRPPAARVQQNSMSNQIAGGVANGIASGASQAVAQALIQGMFGGGGGGGGGGNGGADGCVPADADLYAVDGGSYNQMEGGYEGGDANTTY